MDAERPPQPGSELGGLPEDLFRQLIESISAVTYVYSVGGAAEPPLYVSPQCERVLGLPREALMVDAERRKALLHPEDRERLWTKARAFDATGGDWDEEYRIALPDGTVRWIHDQARVVPGSDGTALWFGVLTDMSRIGQVERALADSETKYRALVEQLPGVVYIESNEPDPQTIYMGPQALELTGYGPQEWMSDQNLWLTTTHPEDRERVKDAWWSAIESQEPFDAEYRQIHRDGRIRWFHDSSRLVLSEDGTPLFWEGITQDVTEAKQAEEELRESEARYRILVEQVPVLVYIDSNDAHPRSLYVSPIVEEMLGHTPEEYYTNRDFWQQTMHPDDWDRVQARWESSVHSGEPFHEEYRHLRPDGSVAWITDDSRPVFGPDGAPLFWQGVIQDVTERRRAEDGVRASEARYRALVEQVPAVVFIDTNDEAPRCVYVSPQAREVLGRPPEEYVSDPSLWMRTIHPDDRERVGERWIRSVHDQQPFADDFRIVRPDGSVAWVHEEAVPIRDHDGVNVWQGLISDVTHHKRVELEIREAEAKYRALVEQLPATAYIMTNDAEPAITYMSPQVTELTGYPPQEWTTDQGLWVRALHDDDRERVLAEWRVAVERQLPFTSEYRSVHQDGRIFWFHDSARLVRSEDGTPLFWEGIAHDITDSKLAEVERRASETRYRALVEQVPAVVYEMGPDDERHTLYVSQHVESIFGYTRKEWLDQPDIWVELLHPDDREVVLAAHDAHNQTGERWSQEYRLIASDGRVVWVRDQAALVRDEEGLPPTWHGVMLDVTDRRELEEQLLQANDELELRVIERTAELAEANEMMALEISERKRAEAEAQETRERYRRLVEDLPAVVYVWHVHDPGDESSRSYTSPQIEQMLGYTPEQWDSPTLWAERVHPHDRERVHESVARAEETGEPYDFEYRYLAKDGHVVWVHSHATLLQRDREGRPFLYQGVLVDITERKEAELKADEAERRLRATEALGSVGLYDFELFREGDARRFEFRYYSPALARMIGSTTEEMMRDPRVWMRSIHPDDVGAVRANIEQQFETGEPSERTYRIIDPVGGIVWVRAESRCVGWDDHGRPSRFQGAIIDVTKELEEQERLRSSSASLRSFVDSIPGIPWMQVVANGPGGGRTIYVGPQVERILGYTEEELLAEPEHFSRMIHPEDRARIKERSRRHDRTGEPWSEEYRMIARDGRVVWFRSEGIASRLDDGTLVWHGIAFDVTALRADRTVELPEITSADPQT